MEGLIFSIGIIAFFRYLLIFDNTERMKTNITVNILTHSFYKFLLYLQ